MRISTQTRYAIRLLLELAVYENGAPVVRLTTGEIARRQCISEKYLESIATKLKKGGLINSAKGVNGGYWLAVPAKDISVGDVMRLMESTYFAVHCVNNPEECCPNFKDCILAAFWGDVETTVSASLDNVNLYDIMIKMQKNNS